MIRALATAACTAGLVMVAAAQTPPPPKADARLALAILAPTARLTVSSPAFASGQPIPLKYSDYGEKVSPALRWDGVPATGKAIAILVEDPDAKEPKPFVHWLLYNLPATTTTVPEGVPGMPRLPELGGALQGRSSRGNTGYMGPRPPKGDPPHHYHFQIVALDAPLTLDPNVSREQVLAAMAGHVVAGGETVGTFAAPASAK